MKVPSALFKRTNGAARGRASYPENTAIHLTEQVRLLTTGALLGFDGGNGSHIQDAARGDRGGEDMGRSRRAYQNRPNRDRVCVVARRILREESVS